MNSKNLEKNYQNKKFFFHQYIKNIKQNMKIDIYNAINTTIICNPYISKFPKNFFLDEKKINKENIIFLFFKNIFLFYLKEFYLFFSYLISFYIYKNFYKKKNNITKDTIGIDVFFLVDNIIKDNNFYEKYFKDLYPILNKYNKKYIFLPRLYNIGKNPFKLIKFFKILNNEKEDFLFEYEFLNYRDFLCLFKMIIIYPFKTLRLLKKVNIKEDILFNYELIKDISNQQFDAFSRYIYGKNISKLENISKIYSWSEFQVIERSFNYAIRKNNSNITLIACQFYIMGETYFNNYINDIDYDLLTAPHRVLVNGKYYILDRKKIFYNLGVSLRYKNIFTFKKNNNLKKNKILLMGSYIKQETQFMLNSIKNLDNVLFKCHPAVDISIYKIDKKVKIVQENIYELFQDISLAISTESGTLVEAVACGVSVIVIASKDNLTSNPLIEYGKGKIWDIAFNENEVKKVYNNLINYRKNNISNIKEIACWYKDNFFINPTEDNIVKVFELKEKSCK